MNKREKGFTLVELLATIVILGILLVIAVPKIENIIHESKIGILSSTAKTIARDAEVLYAENKSLGITENIKCEDVVNLDRIEYEFCNISFVNNLASVTIKGSGKFDGLFVCDASKSDAKVVDSCLNENVNLIIELDGGIVSKNQSGLYKEGTVIELEEPIKLGYTFTGWTVTGKDASVNDGILTIGTEDTTITAKWEEENQSGSLFAKSNWATIVAAVQNGNHSYNVGDEKSIDLGELGIHTIRVANISPCDGTLLSQTACGFVLEFADVITTHEMISTTNAGGWPATTMRTYVNETIYNAIPIDLRNGIIDTYVVSGRNYSDKTGTLENYNFESIDKLYLLSSKEVYGSELVTEAGSTRQLDYYATYEGDDYTGVSEENYEGAAKIDKDENDYWLRSIPTSALMANQHFHLAMYDGCLDYATTNLALGVAPAFRLAN